MNRNKRQNEKCQDMNRETIAGGGGAILGAYVLQKLIQISPNNPVLSNMKGFPTLLLLLGVVLIAAGILGVE